MLELTLSHSSARLLRSVTPTMLACHATLADACYAAAASAVGRSHCTLRVFVCQKYVRPCASLASDQPSGSGWAAAPSAPDTMTVQREHLHRICGLIASKNALQNSTR